MTQHWGILGGGVLGLSLARELLKRGARVTVCEAAPYIGGLASAWRLGDITWDRHYHVTLLSDTALRGLLDELDLERDIQWTKTRTGFFVDGTLVPMSDAIEFLRFPAIGVVDKARLAATILYASRVRDWRRLEQVPVSDWLRRLSGENTFEKVWRPLLMAKLGSSYKDVSAAFIWTTINRLYAARRAGMKQEMFGYVPGGYAKILDRFSRYLSDRGVDIRLNCGAKRIARSDGGLTVSFADGTSQRFDRIATTFPAHSIASTCEGLTEPERTALNGIRYQGIVCASVLLDRPLAGYYVTNITDPEVPFTGVIEMSALVDPAQFGGRYLVYLPKYAAPDDECFSWSDEEVRRRFLQGLRRIYPDVSDANVTAFQVSRVRSVFALPTLRYSERLPPVRTSVPGLYALNSAHIVNGTLNVNESILLAQRGAEMMA